jgi:hypothetical protein
MRVLERSIRSFEGRSAKGHVRMQAFNEHVDPFEPLPPLPVLLMSDVHVLKPDERISFTTQWTLALPGMEASPPTQAQR